MNHEKFIQITDEQLSAFLDAELPEADMEMIREQLIEDENLANRLAELAMVDELVAISYKTIDKHPIPDSIHNLLAEQESKSENVIRFPLFKKIQKNIQIYSAVAAGVVLAVGFGVSQSFHKEPGDWQSIAQILEHTASGVEQLSANGTQIKPRLTFINTKGDYCRQFAMRDKDHASENIACRKNNNWKISGSLAVEKTQQAGTYQTASGGSALNEKIEKMAKGEFFDAQAESDAITLHWVKSK